MEFFKLLNNLASKLFNNNQYTSITTLNIIMDIIFYTISTFVIYYTYGIDIILILAIIISFAFLFRNQIHIFFTNNLVILLANIIFIVCTIIIAYYIISNKRPLDANPALYTVFPYYQINIFPLVPDFSTLMGFPKPANETMFNIIALLTEMTILLIFVLFGVLLTLSYIVDVYSAKNNPFPRHFEKTVESTLDVLFVVFPTVLIIYLLIPSLGFIFNNEITVESIFEIDVIGHQWYWSYEYHLSVSGALYSMLDNQVNSFNVIEFESIMDTEATYNRLLQVDKRILIPVDTYIKVNITSQDVIHSWAIPQLGIKYDAIPGRIITCVLSSNVIGVFYGQCSELCGVNHAFMPICVQSVEDDIFYNWLALSTNINMSRIILDLLIGPVNFDKMIANLYQ